VTTDHPPHNGKPTSILAAEEIKPTVARLREQVYAFIRDRGKVGATREEIETSLAINSNSCRPRVWELLKANRIAETQETRLTRSGRKAVVLVAVEWKER